MSPTPAPAAPTDAELGPELADTLARLRGQIRPDAEVDALEADRRRERILRLQDEAGFPARALEFVRHAHKPKVPWDRCAEKLEGLVLKAGGSLVALVGPQGTGKTCLAVHALCHAARHLRVPRFESAVGMVAALNDAKFEGRLKATLHEYEAVGVLAIDQWDKIGGADWEGRYLFEIVDRRYNAGLCTVLIANVPPIPAALAMVDPGSPSRRDWIVGAFAAIVGPSLLGRINETGGLIVTDWDSFR